MKTVEVNPVGRRGLLWAGRTIAIAGTIATAVCSVFWLWEVLQLIVLNFRGDVTPVQAVRSFFLQPTLLMLTVAAFVAYFGAGLAEYSEPPPAPGELWRHRVNLAERQLLTKLREVRALGRGEEKWRVADELEDRQNRLRARYFPPERPPRRYRKLSDC